VTLIRVNAFEPGRFSLRVQRRGAFTLVEILLVVALLGIIATAFISSAADMFRSKEPRIDDVFWQGVTAARQLALDSNQIVVLRYDEEKHQLAWAGELAAGNTLVFPGKQLQFLPVVAQGMILLGGQLTETDAIKLVRFYPDGCCDAFRAQLVDNTDRRSVLNIDPWTCAPVIEPPQK
jgi:prepilin-type N-terminal cleavage/methylation domain-containing protein